MPTRSAATVTQTAHPTCKLGIAAHWSAPADTVLLPHDKNGWCVATTSWKPSPGSKRGGVSGHIAKQPIAISVLATSTPRAQR